MPENQAITDVQKQHEKITKQNARQIARALARYPLVKPVVLLLHPESAALGSALAQTLRSPLDFIGTWDIQLAQQSQFILASVTEDGTTHFAQQTLALLGIHMDEMQGKVTHASRRAAELVQRIRQGRPLADVKGRTGLLVAGANLSAESVAAAARLLRNRGVHSIILLAPQLSISTTEEMRKSVDHLFCLRIIPKIPKIPSAPPGILKHQEETLMSLLEQSHGDSREVDISDGVSHLPGVLRVPDGARGLIVFAQTESSEHSQAADQYCAKVFNDHGWATLRFKLLTPTEEQKISNLHDIPFLAARIILATRLMSSWISPLPIGYFGNETGAAAALWAGAQLGDEIRAIAVRSCPLDLSPHALSLVTAETLLLSPANDARVIEGYRDYLKSLRHGELVLIRGGATEQIATQAQLFFEQTLGSAKISERKAA
ncbi:MAG: hypothetical protein A2Z97_12345 [Bdellovibrionales bacterium GWB1_52_6]|nr:MAG: hypothetical protein A2Z97_12345 [Bdellovibrionales bacterium GWB1_52_6]OFZ03731.1 MAG: hypothetical protein A2X97_14325 [Bdellovibrionales bacterium GWA1_52_35]HCM38757.1 hypothetical protein [Bdellovibrionales bacterium]